MQTIAGALREAKARIPDEAHWFRGETTIPLAMGSRCMVAALPKQNMRIATEVAKLLMVAIGASKITDMSEWNDAPGRTFAEVQEAFDLAIMAAELRDRQARLSGPRSK